MITLLFFAVSCILFIVKPSLAIPLILLVAYATYHLIFGHKIILTLTQTGITDHRTPFGEISWLEVEHIGIRMNGNQLVIAIGEIEWDELLEKLSKFKALIYQFNLPGDIIFIGKYSTDMPLKQLYELIIEYADRAHDCSSQAIGEAKS